MKTLKVALAVTGVTLGVGVALAGIGEHHRGSHEFAKAAFCSRLTDEHVRAHTEELSSWVQRELALTPTQATALTPLTEGLSEWAHDLAPVCDMTIVDGPSHVAALVQLTDASQRAVARFAVAFNELYGTLDAEQRRTVDGWMNHDHGSFPHGSFNKGSFNSGSLHHDRAEQPAP